MNFVDEHRATYGVEPICSVLPIAPSTYYEQKARRRDPGRLPARAKRDEVLREQIRQVHHDNYDVYGGGTVWSLRGLDGQLLREWRAENGMHSFRDYVWTGRNLLAKIEREPTPGFGVGTWTETREHAALDHLGTVRIWTDASGSQLPGFIYYPFGKQLTSYHDDEQIKFTGHERDLWNTASTADDLDYMHARHYNPQIARFLQIDPLAGSVRRPQSLNRYGYVTGGPLSRTDPSGREERHATQCQPEDWTCTYPRGGEETISITAAPPSPIPGIPFDPGPIEMLSETWWINSTNGTRDGFTRIWIRGIPGLTDDDQNGNPAVTDQNSGPKEIPKQEPPPPPPTLADPPAPTPPLDKWAAFWGRCDVSTVMMGVTAVSYVQTYFTLGAACGAAITTGVGTPACVAAAGWHVLNKAAFIGAMGLEARNCM